MDYAVSDIYTLICENDGGTFFLTDAYHERLSPTVAIDGYMVAQAGREYIVSVDDFSPADIAAYIRQHLSTLIHGSYFGAWISDGRVYLDISDRFFDLDEAMLVGANNRQLAIWDIAAGKEIDL